MSSKNNISGIFGGYLFLIYVIGEIIATFIVYILTGKNYKKLGNQRYTNLFIGWIAICIAIPSLLSIFQKGQDPLFFVIVLPFLLGILTVVSEIIRAVITHKEEKEVESESSKSISSTKSASNRRLQ